MYRKCVGCNEMKDRGELIKITRKNPCGTIIINPDCNTFGRSAYLCYNNSCIETAFKKNRLSKVLKAPVKEQLLDELRNYQSK